MHPPKTFELRATPLGDHATRGRTKARLVDWLLANGVESFVEGALDCDINHDYAEPTKDYYEALGGEGAALSIYRYGKESLEELKFRIEREFGKALDLAVHEMETATWMEGWKESFKPFSTTHFYVRPPWEPKASGELTDLVIEPGMAFGTGQHATTRLCLGVMENLPGDKRGWSLLDVGTGTGILAIAAAKLGFGSVQGTDIEEDAVRAAVENAQMNQVALPVSRGSVPPGGPWDLVVANILTVVLERIMGPLARAVVPGGYLLLSGLLVEEEAHLVELATREGLVRVGSETLTGWAALLLNKPKEQTPEGAGS